MKERLRTLTLLVATIALMVAVAWPISSLSPDKATEKIKKKDESIMINLSDEVFKPNEGNICQYYEVNHFGRYRLTVELKMGTYILCIKEKPELNR